MRFQMSINNKAVIVLFLIKHVELSAALPLGGR
jgi:hypothetical protein